jgi:hypothetical protein
MKPLMFSRLRPVALATGLACLWPMLSYAQTAGTLEFVQGSVVIHSSAGASRAAERGAAVQSGETIDTQSGRAQMRMSTGTTKRAWLTAESCRWCAAVCVP